MPSYSTHRRVYEIIGLSAGYCFVNDRIVDEDPPRKGCFPGCGQHRGSFKALWIQG
ncbi:MAG: hypothetical protein GU361_00275 [Desulfurococcales archaeon]|nr:hypothetical protein [Desulfurococcales archaeon]